MLGEYQSNNMSLQKGSITFISKYVIFKNNQSI